MPWIAYANLTDHDLETILLYLKSQRAIEFRGTASGVFGE